jgi:DNA-binding transcriptional LysR family regulator
LAVHAYASPEYLERAGAPQHPAELATHECLGFPKTAAWQLFSDAETVDVPVGGKVRANSVGMLRRVATLGMGVALLPVEIAANDVTAGRLVRMLTHWQAKPIPVYALTETRLLPAKTQRFIEFLQAHLSDRNE